MKLVIKPEFDLFKEFEKRLDALIAQVNNKLLTYDEYDYYN